MNSKKKLGLLFFSMVIQLSFAQTESFLGLWEVKKVSMDNKAMTPVAKWAKYNADGTYESGNGWLKSIDGRWTFDKENHYLESIDILGIKDEMGGFTISFDGETMVWKRMEFGNEVKVILQRITKLPMSPADYLEGVWVMNDKTEKIHFRWDRIINFYDENNKKTSGYWHIHGHRPDITLLPHTPNQSPESWRITVDASTLTMTGISDTNKNKIKKYTRSNILN